MNMRTLNKWWRSSISLNILVDTKASWHGTLLGNAYPAILKRTGTMLVLISPSKSHINHPHVKFSIMYKENTKVVLLNKFSINITKTRKKIFCGIT